MIVVRSALLATLVAALSFACSSSTTDDAPSTAATDAGTNASPTDSFTELVAQPLSRSCGSCHGESKPEQGLVLDGVTSDQLKLHLVDVPSTETTSMNLITPGDPDNSYLVRKIKGTLTGLTCSTTCGNKMPLGNAYAAESLQDLEDWIKGGAK